MKADVQNKSKTNCLALSRNYLFFLEGLCAKALPAAVFEAFPVRPSRRTLEAAVAARLDVCLLLLAMYSPPSFWILNSTPSLLERLFHSRYSIHHKDRRGQVYYE